MEACWTEEEGHEEDIETMNDDAFTGPSWHEMTKRKHRVGA